MQANFDVRSASPAELAKQRDEHYYALPPAGKRAQGMLVIWAAGIGGVTGDEIDKVILDKRVQLELRQTPVDAVGLSDAVELASIGHGGRLYDALRQPREKLLLLGAINRR